MALSDTIKSAIENAVNLINEIGVTCYFMEKDGTIKIKLKAMVREMSTAELVSDYRQGDMKVELDANAVSQPKKYDVLTIENKRYALKDDATPRRVGDTTYTWRFVVRGR